MKTTLLRAAALGFALSVAGLGAAQAETPSAHALDLAKRYVAATKMDVFFEGLVASMSPVLIAPQVTASGPLSATQMKVVEEATTETTAEVSRQMADQAAPQLASVYTEKQLEEMVAFFESPTGQAVVNNSPEIAERMLPMAEQMVPQIQAKMRAKVCGKISCSAPARNKALKAI